MRDRQQFSAEEGNISRTLRLAARLLHFDVKTSEFGSQDPGGHLFHRWLNGVHVFCTSSFGKPGTQRRVPFLEAGDVF
jgi:hypothetical protein